MYPYHLRPLPPTPKKSHVDWGPFKTVCLCVAHTALQAHPKEFLEFQHQVFETVEIVTLGQGIVKNLDFRVLLLLRLGY